MRSITVRSVPDEVHRAIRLRAARNGRSTEAEIREILADAVKPEGRVRLGSLLAGIGRRAGLTDEDVEAIRRGRDSSPARTASFE